MRQRASPSAPCQTPQSLLHKSCIYPATQSTVFKPLIPSAIVARRGSHPSTWLWMRANVNQIWTIRGTIQGKDVKEAWLHVFGPTSSSWQGKRSSRPPCQVRARVARSLPWRTRTNEHARSGGNGWQSKCCRQTWSSDGAKIAAVWPSESARSHIDPPSIGLVITMNSPLC